MREQVIFLTSDENLVSSNKNFISSRYDSLDSLRRVIKSFQDSPASSHLFVITDELKKLWNDFKSLFEPIRAAGGVITNSKEDVLFIFRNGKWDLPKGKIETGEKITYAAIREVKEECGISEVKIIKKMIPTYHIYSLREKNILKKTYWFAMKVNGYPELKPQTEEGITRAQWVGKNEINEVVKNTYPSVKELLERCRT